MIGYTEQLDTLAKQYIAISGINTGVLSDLATRLQKLQSDYAHTVQIDKPVVTIPSIFRRAYDENFISDYLAHILHPINSGLGFAPLQSLIDFAGITTSLNSQDGVGLQVFREYQLSDESRIDILIVLRKAKLLIALENKVFSSEGYKQTVRYTAAIQETFPAYTQVLFYLTPGGKVPTSPEFKPLSYAELLSALRSFQPSGISERDRFIYQDFLLHVENYIMKSVNLKLSEKSLLYLKNVEMIAELQEAFSQDASTAFQVLSDIIKGAFEGLGDDWDFSFSEDRGYQQAWKKHWRTAQLWIHYEFWLSKDSLFTDSKFSFMVDVEGKAKDPFLDKFDQLQSRLKAKYQNASIQYRPKSRKLAIAFKDYNFQLSPDGLDRSVMESSFQKAIDELVFLVEPIEQTLAKNKSK